MKVKDKIKDKENKIVVEKIILSAVFARGASAHFMLCD